MIFFFFVLELQNMKRKQKKGNRVKNIEKKKQRKVFLNRYDFAYAGRDILNQLGKVAHGVIKSAS